MAQNYTEQLRKDNVRDAIYEDLQNNCEVLRTSWSGNAFPANPKVGQPCYRVDEDKLYYWDGLKWSQKGGGGSAELKSMELPAIETERVSIILEGARCLDKNMMFVFVDKIAQDPSTYSMSDDGTVVNFNPAIPANAAVTLRWFDTDVGTFDTAIFASDAEFAAGELTNRAPNVKQVHSLSDMVASKLSGLELMDVGFAPLGIDESKNKRRYLNGQVIIQSQFPAFTAAVKARMSTMANAFTTEENWQSEKTNSKLGQCGKFVVDDTAGTIRLPCVVNAQGLVDLALIGGIKSESLPTAVALVGYNGVSGEFRQKVANYTYTSDSHQGNTSAPMSSETTSGSQVDYLNDKPVQQEAVQYPYYIQVATGVEETLPAIREYQINTPFFFGQSMYSDVAPDNASWLASNGQYNAKTVYPDYYDWLVEQMNAGVDRFKGTVGYAWKSQTADIRFWTAIRNPSVGCAVYGGPGIPFAGTVTSINPDGTLNFYEDSTGVNYENLVYTESENINNEGTAFANLKFANDYDFVVNTTDQTFRLPLKNGQEGVFADGVKGNGMTLGATNGSTNFGLNVTTGTTTAWDGYSGSYGTQVGSTSSGTLNPQNKSIGITTDPTKSGMVVDKTVPSGWNLYYYIGDTVQDASLINAGAVLGQLSDKISRTAASDREMVVGWGMPDYSAGIAISGYTTASNQFTAPKDGILSITVNSNTNGNVYIDNTPRACVNNNDSYARASITLPISKGEKFYAPSVINMTNFTSCFYPLKGVN